MTVSGLHKKHGMIPGLKGGLPEASWHTTDKCGYTFSFVNTCQGFTTGISSFVLKLLTAASLEACCLLRADYCQKQGVVLCHHHLTHHTHSGHHPRCMFCISSVEPRGPFCLAHMEGLRVPVGWQRRCMRPAFHYPSSFGFLAWWFLLAQSESPPFCLHWTIWSPVFGALTCLNCSSRITLTLSSLTFTPVSDPQLYSFFFNFWLHWIFAVVLRLSSCGAWAWFPAAYGILVPGPGIKPVSPCIERQSQPLDHQGSLPTALFLSNRTNCTDQKRGSLVCQVSILGRDQVKILKRKIFMSQVFFKGTRVLLDWSHSCICGADRHVLGSCGS